MTDHANELRRHARKIAHPAGDVPAVMRAAADEIERLRAEHPRGVVPRNRRSSCCRPTPPAQTAPSIVGPVTATGYSNRFPLYAQPAPSVPDGWKLVPIEPTEEMREVGVFAGGAYYDVVEAVYEAMLTAAPEAKP